MLALKNGQPVSALWNERYVMFEHIEDRSQKLLADMTDRDIEMLPFGTFLCQIVLKGLVPHRYEAS